MVEARTTMPKLTTNRRTLSVTFVAVIAFSSQESLAGETPSEGGEVTTAARLLEDAAISSIGVTLDHAKLLKLREPAQTVVIGNPGIVDGTISDQNTLILTGKSIGSTNLIILGEAGRQISNFVVSVAANGRERITVHNGLQYQTYSCIGSCSPAATPK